jgi:hypothetical protein
VPPLGRRRRRPAIGQYAACHQEREAPACGGACEDQRRLPKQVRSADHQAESDEVLEQDEPGIGAVEKACACERRAIVEHGHADSGPGRDGEKRDRQARLQTSQARREHESHQHKRGRGVAEVERRPDSRLRRSPRLGIEARGGQAQPLESERVEHDCDRHGDRVAPKVAWPEELRDEKPEREVEGCVDEEGDDDAHPMPQREPCAAAAPACSGKASPRPGKNVLR